MAPESPTTQPFRLSAKSILQSRLNVVTTCVVHVVPPLVVRRTFPPYPITQPRSTLVNLIPMSGTLVPVVRRLHVSPPSVVLNTFPKVAAAYPVFESTKSTDVRRDELEPMEGRTRQEEPRSVVETNVPKAPTAQNPLSRYRSEA